MDVAMDPNAGFFLNYILEEWFHVKGLQCFQSIRATAMMSVIIINVSRKA